MSKLNLIKLYNQILNEKYHINEDKNDQIYTKFDNIYNYKVINGEWVASKKNNPNIWFNIKKYPGSISKLDKAFPNARNLNKDISNIQTISKNKNVIKPITVESLKSSSQVINQVNYLKQIKFNKPFTILDDKNSLVYAINSDYTIYKRYPVITGKEKGDDENNYTFMKWFKTNLWKNLKFIFNKFIKEGYDIKKIVNELEEKYFSVEIVNIKQTPSGIYKRDPSLFGISGFLRNKIMLWFFEDSYGKQYISWKNLNNILIPFGFHGTKMKYRLNVLEKGELSSPKLRKLSYGCINFSNKDILDINNFIKIGQYSFWLPDKTNDIVKFNKK